MKLIVSGSSNSERYPTPFPRGNYPIEDDDEEEEQEQHQVLIQQEKVSHYFENNDNDNRVCLCIN